MKSLEIDRWCNLYEECLRSEVAVTVEEFVAAQQLPQDPSLIAELRQLFSEYHPTTLQRVVNAFAAGDYAEVIRTSESGIGPWTIAETVRLRLIASQRPEQYKSVETLSEEDCRTFDCCQVVS